VRPVLLLIFTRRPAKGGVMTSIETHPTLSVYHLRALHDDRRRRARSPRPARNVRSRGARAGRVVPRVRRALGA
jgi:hypothetical protein